MTIDKSGKWWRGTTAEDLDAFLSDYTTSASYAANRFEHPRCTCGEDRFALEVDDEQGCARRTCAACGEQHFMLDSDEYSSDASLEECACPCGGETFQLAVAFSHRAEGSIKWVTIGARCTACGVLGAYTDWKIDYEPAGHLYDAL
jgi:hypothetical protein